MPACAKPRQCAAAGHRSGVCRCPVLSGFSAQSGPDSPASWTVAGTGDGQGPVRRHRQLLGVGRMLITRETTTTITPRDYTAIRPLARPMSGRVSLGLKATRFV